MTTAEMQALIDRLEGHLAWINDFGPDGTLKVDLRMVVDYLKRVCPPRESVFADGACGHAPLRKEVAGGSNHNDSL